MGGGWEGIKVSYQGEDKLKLIHVFSATSPEVLSFLLAFLIFVFLSLFWLFWRYLFCFGTQDSAMNPGVFTSSGSLSWAMYLMRKGQTGTGFFGKTRFCWHLTAILTDLFLIHVFVQSAHFIVLLMSFLLNSEVVFWTSSSFWLNGCMRTFVTSRVFGKFTVWYFQLMLLQLPLRIFIGDSGFQQVLLTEHNNKAFIWCLFCIVSYYVLLPNYPLNSATVQSIFGEFTYYVPKS